jgi:hypothetical protein
MPFNSSKDGFQNEDEFIKCLDSKKICDIKFNLRFFLEDVFGVINDEDMVRCYKSSGPYKYDIIIEINNKIKRISIKKGVKNSVHAEPISEFVHFLILNKMPRKMVINFLKYHYADGSTNGSGANRISISEYKRSHQKEIDEINKFLNNKNILIKAINRFVIKGRNSIYKIDVLLYGVPDDFIWIKRKDIYKILLNKRNEYSTSIHFSSLTYQPMNRCLNNNSKYERDRYIAQLKWYNLGDDIIENMNNSIVMSSGENNAG